MSDLDVLATDSIQTKPGVDGIDFDTNHESLAIESGVFVFSLTSFGVASAGFHSNILSNNGGMIYSAADTGVRLTDGPGNVANGSGGVIFGARDGVDLGGSGNQTVANLGKIIGGDNNGVYFDTSTNGPLFVYNYKYIFGAVHGVWVNSNYAGGYIDNAGTIKFDNLADGLTVGAAIYITTGRGISTTIFNEKGAVIEGPGNAIYAGAGGFDLTNEGTIVGNVIDASGEDISIVNKGKVEGDVYLEGKSVFKGAGGSSGSIHVGSGNATVTGGYHPDRFVFDSTLAGQVTKITNFYHGSVPSGGDKIVLSEKDFSAVGVGAIGHALPGASFHVGASAKTLSQHIVYNHANGFLYYDPSGSAGSQIHFATLTSLPDITHSDFVIEA